jgi:hypothetical protein
MDAAASSNATAIPCDPSGEGPLVILVGGAGHYRAIGAASARLAAHVTVVRYDRGGRGTSGDTAPSAAGRAVEQLEALIGGAASMVLVLGVWPGGVLAGRRGDAMAPFMAGAAGLPSQAGRNVFRREGEYWTVCYQGSVVRVKDAKGLHHLARLLAHPGREFHAADLEAAETQPAPAAPVGSRDRAAGGELAVRPDLGDAGELLDATAKAAYKARLEKLRAELEEAEGCNDPARAGKARVELDFLVGELARAVGLGGRDRRAASHAERARLNATRAIRAAMANLARAHPSLGRHLAATVRTGRYCAYTPDPRAPIAWEH